MNRKKLEIDVLATETWGAAFVREFELTIAANVLESMRTGATLYESVLLSRVAERCMPLDEGLEETELGIVDVPSGPAADEWRTLEKTLSVLDGRPRGTWAVFRKDGKYDAYMSDGYGGRATRSGHKFEYRSPFAPDLAFAALYAETLSMATYLTRNRIQNEIVAYSASVAAVEPGSVAVDKTVGGIDWGRVELLEKRPGGFSGGGDMYVVRCRGRGRRPKDYQMGVDGLAGVFDVPMVMPPEYADPHASERIRTIGEARQEAAQRAWDTLDESETEGLSRLGTRAEFRREGNVLVRPVYEGVDAPEGPCGRFEVRFLPGCATIVAAELERDRTPSPAF